MNYPQAIVAAAGILAGAIVVSNMAQTAPAPAGENSARYQIAATPGKAVANAWRIDMKTGDLYRCFATGGMFGAVCRQARFYDPGDEESEGPDKRRTNLPMEERLARWSRR